MKIDTSVLQTGALVIIGVVMLMAAVEGNWSIVNIGLAGMFAVLNIHPKPPGADNGAS